jgi:hypothetical protein
MGPLANDPQQATAANGYRSPHIAIGPPIDIKSNVTDFVTSYPAPRCGRSADDGSAVTFTRT